MKEHIGVARFLLLFDARSGSTTLCEILDQHQRIVMLSKSIYFPFLWTALLSRDCPSKWIKNMIGDNCLPLQTFIYLFIYLNTKGIRFKGLKDHLIPSCGQQVLLLFIIVSLKSFFCHFLSAFDNLKK